MIRAETLNFIQLLKENNHREWFQENKALFEDAKQDFLNFIDKLIVEIGHFDPSILHHSAKDCAFRIYRDVRFSKDKSPYKTHFGAHITSAAKRSEIHSRAGYYIHIEPGKSILAGGAYLPASPWLKAIRQEIDFNADGLRAVTQDKDFKKYFGEMTGEKLKTAPRDYPKDHKEIELLKHKSFLAQHNLSDEMVLSGQFLSHSASVFQALYPFDKFLNDTLL